MQFQFTHTGCSGRASLLPQKRVIRVAEVRLHWSEMKSLFHPTPDCSIHLWHPERWCTGVRRVLLCPFLQHQGQGFNDLTSLLRPKKGLSLLAAWLVLKAESCKAKISEGIQRGLTTGDTCYYTHMSARWRSPQEPKVGEHPTLPLTRTACSWSLRQILSVVFLVRALYSWPPPGWTLDEPSSGRQKGNKKPGASVPKQDSIASMFFAPESSPGCVLLLKGTRLNPWGSAGSRSICNVAQEVIQPLVMLYTTSLPDASTP